MSGRPLVTHVTYLDQEQFYYGAISGLFCVGTYNLSNSRIGKNN